VRTPDRREVSFFGVRLRQGDQHGLGVQVVDIGLEGFIGSVPR
jgi:hypothetical protein